MKKTIGSGVNKTIDCTQKIYPGLNLLFGEDTSDNNSYFDATAYLQSSEEFKEKTVEDFFDKFSFITESFRQSYEIASDKQVLINTDDHQLLHGCFAFIFICYTDPSNLGYLNDRINEMFSYGFAVSDDYISYQAQQRFGGITAIIHADDIHPR